jgi:hypothetical protein
VKVVVLQHSVLFTFVFLLLVKIFVKENKESLNFLKGIKPTFSVKVNKQTKIQTTSNHKILSKFSGLPISTNSFE